MRVIPIADLEPGGSNAPINDFEDLDVSPVETAYRLRRKLPGGHPFDALVVNRGSDTAFVALHGATDRSKTVLPRFEWLRSLLAYNCSSVYFADPGLHLSPRIMLAWYTGWDDVDVHLEIANWSAKIAEVVGAKRVVVMGASGGGFAALQVSSLMPHSEVLAFNAQTDISAYRVNGESWGVQRDYIQTVWPGVWSQFRSPESYKDGRWVDLVGDRVSALRRYSSPRQNLVHIVQNEQEFHFHDHFLPFLDSARVGGNEVVAHTNREGAVHNPPRAVTFQRHVDFLLSSQ